MSKQPKQPGGSLACIQRKQDSSPFALIGDLADQEALDKALAIGQAGKAIILLNDISLLYDYVARIPELAWDLIDFAEKPLTVVFEEGKNVPDALLRENRSIAVSLVKEPAVLKHIRAARKGSFYLPIAQEGLQEDVEGPILSPLQNVIILQQEFLNSPQAKTARLGMDGAFKFL